MTHPLDPGTTSTRHKPRTQVSFRNTGAGNAAGDRSTTRRRTLKRDRQWRRRVLAGPRDMDRVDASPGSEPELARVAGWMRSGRPERRRRSSGFINPHDRNRALRTLITAQLAADKLTAWGIDPPKQPLAQIAAYLEHRDAHRAATTCPVCGDPVTRPLATYCGDACKKAAYRARRRGCSGAAAATRSVTLDPRPGDRPHGRVSEAVRLIM